VVLAAASAVMLAAIVYAVGARRTLEAVGQAGFTAFGAVGLTLLASLLLRATAWAVLNRPIRHRAPFRTLLAAETVGQAGNILTPSTYLGGEPLKVVYVGRTTGHRYGEVAGTVLLSKYVEMTSFAFVFAAGTVIACVAFRDVLLSGAHFWAGVMLLTVAAAILGLFVALWLAMSREWCPLRRIVRGLARLGPFHRFFARLAWRTGKMEKQVSRVVAEEGGAVRVVFALFLGVHAMILVRPVVFFWAGWRFGLGLGEMSLIFAASQALLCFQFTPSGVGTLDGGLLGVFALLGLGDAQCMAYLLCQRFWDTVVVAAGITLAGQAGTKIVAEKLGGIAPAGGAAGGGSTCRGRRTRPATGRRGGFPTSGRRRRTCRATPASGPRALRLPPACGAPGATSASTATSSPPRRRRNSSTSASSGACSARWPRCRPAPPTAPRWPWSATSCGSGATGRAFSTRPCWPASIPTRPSWATWRRSSRRSSACRGRSRSSRGSTPPRGWSTASAATTGAARSPPCRSPTTT